MTNEPIKPSFSVCYREDPCLFKFPQQEQLAGQLINYSTCRSSGSCEYRNKVIDNLNSKKESVLEKDVKSE